MNDPHLFSVVDSTLVGKNDLIGSSSMMVCVRARSINTLNVMESEFMSLQIADEVLSA